MGVKKKIHGDTFVSLSASLFVGKNTTRGFSRNGVIYLYGWEESCSDLVEPSQLRGFFFRIKRNICV